MGVVRVRDGIIWGSSRSLLYDTLESLAGRTSNSILKNIIEHAILRNDSFFDFSGLRINDKSDFVSALKGVIVNREADPTLAADQFRSRTLELQKELLTMVEDELARITDNHS